MFGCADLVHKLLLNTLDISCKLPPGQIVVGPLAEILGAAGIGLAETATTFETFEVHPFNTCLTE